MHSPMMHRVASGMPARASAARDMVLGSGIFYLLSNAGACGIPSIVDTIWCGWHDFVGWVGGRWPRAGGGPRGRDSSRHSFPP